MTIRVAFEAEVFLWTGEGGWHFARLPHDVAEEIDELVVGPRRGFGSLKVRARIGDTEWTTSIFPERQDDGRTYLLPVKKPVRDAEGILTDDVVRVELAVIEGDEGVT